MKLLVICSAVDLGRPAAGVPVTWQFLKGFHETGTEVIVITLEGASFATPWWRIYSRPHVQNKAFDFALNKGRMTQKITEIFYYHSWEKHLTKVLTKEKDIDAVLLIDSSHLAKNFPNWIRRRFGIPTIYYETDIQNLPRYSLDHQPDRHLFPDYSDCDAVTCSFEKISQEFREHGLQNVWTIGFGADPDIFRPMQEVKQDMDVYFSGFGAIDRENWMKNMISIPSRSLCNRRFAVDGAFNIDLGNAKRIQGGSLEKYIHLCQKSKINLNILRQQFVTAGVLNSRIFELASLGCCVVTNPSECLNENFEINKEIIVVKDGEDAIDKYNWLLSCDEDRIRIGIAARNRILKEHTYLQRAQQMIKIVQKINH